MMPATAAVMMKAMDWISLPVAAGNSNANACNYSPSSEPSAITVGATGNNDARASFSNFGNCVDVFAPGVNVTSDWNSSDSATAVLSGTSMATPHTTGVAALNSGRRFVGIERVEEYAALGARNLGEAEGGFGEGRGRQLALGAATGEVEA